MKRREFLINSSVIACGLPLVGCYNSENTSTILNLNPDIHKFTIGEFQCTIFRDLMFKYKAKDFFVNAEEEELKQSLDKYKISPENIPSPFVALLLQNKEKKILIDTGIGFSETPLTFKGGELLLQGKLTSLLGEEGINHEDITDVILTHFHPDHIGGVFSADGRLNFPNAKFYVHEDEWNFWHSSQSDSQPPLFKLFVEKNITPLAEKNLEIINVNSREIVPGINMVKAEGHTPGHFALVINKGSDKLMYISDAFLHPLHIERLDWQTIYDYDHKKAKQTRMKLLDIASKEDMLVHAFHFDFPGLGRVEKFNNNWVWNYADL